MDLTPSDCLAWNMGIYMYNLEWRSWSWTATSNEPTFRWLGYQWVCLPSLWVLLGWDQSVFITLKPFQKSHTLIQPCCSTSTEPYLICYQSTWISSNHLDNISRSLSFLHTIYFSNCFASPAHWIKTQDALFQMTCLAHKPGSFPTLTGVVSRICKNHINWQSLS